MLNRIPCMNRKILFSLVKYLKFISKNHNIPVNIKSMMIDLIYH